VKIRFFSLIFLFLCIGMFLLACGKKGPPVPRAPLFTATVRNLSVAVENDPVVLKGGICGKTNYRESISGCKVY